MRLGMVTDIHFDLCDGKPKPKAEVKKRDDKSLLPKCCEICSSLMPAYEPKCLSCGHELTKPQIFTADGQLTMFAQRHLIDGLVRELREMGVTMRVDDEKRLKVKAPGGELPVEVADRIRANRDDLVRILTPRENGAGSVKGELQKRPKQEIYSMLLTYADERNYKKVGLPTNIGRFSTFGRVASSNTKSCHRRQCCVRGSNQGRSVGRSQQRMGHRMQPLESIHDIARGRWPNLFPELGVPVALLNGKHQACPMCGGKDRFRFTDHGGTGAYICNQCGNGSGVDLVMKLRQHHVQGCGA